MTVSTKPVQTGGPAALSKDAKARVEMRHLRYFVAVAEELNFNRAAERLGMAQPPLSQQIKQLESELQIILFNRTSRGVDLTPGGKAFLAQARLLLARTEIAVTEARRVAREEHEELRLGAVYSALFSFAPRLMRRLGERFPEMFVHLSEMTISDQMAALRDGAIDAGLVRMPVSAPYLATRILLEEPLIAILPMGHALLDQTAVSLEELAREPLIVSGYGPEPSFRQQVLWLFRERGIPVTVSRQVPDMHTLIAAVGMGLGVSLVPGSIERTQFADVAYRPLLDDIPTVALALAWNRDLHSPIVEKLIDVAAEGIVASPADAGRT